MNHLASCTRKALRRGLRPTTLLLFLLGLSSVWAQAPEDKPAPLLGWGTTPPDIPDGYMIIEGDIQVPIGFDQVDMPWSTDFWPGGVVVYEFDDNVTPANRANMRNAMKRWSAVANVRFSEEGSCGLGHCVHIQDSAENSSEVGRQFFRQTINIHDWGFPFVICHELAHTLGFWHEQSRTDRDTFVQINWAHIQSGEEYNSDRQDDSGRYGPYDFDSLMHYGRRDFSSDGQDTITVLPPNETWQSRIGQRDHLSRMDQLIMGFIYSFPSWRFVDRNYSGTESGTFFQPYRNFIPGVNATPNGGTLWVQPGGYTARGTYTPPMTWEGAAGGGQAQ